MDVLPACVSTPFSCLLPGEAKRGIRFRGTGVTDELRAAMWVLGMETRSSGQSRQFWWSFLIVNWYRKTQCKCRWHSSLSQTSGYIPVEEANWALSKQEMIFVLFLTVDVLCGALHEKSPSDPGLLTALHCVRWVPCPLPTTLPFPFIWKSVSGWVLCGPVDTAAPLVPHDCGLATHDRLECPGTKDNQISFPLE